MQAKTKYILIFILVIFILTGLKLAPYLIRVRSVVPDSKMSPIEVMCKRNTSVEVCPNGDYVVGRLNSV